MGRFSKSVVEIFLLIFLVSCGVSQPESSNSLDITPTSVPPTKVLSSTPTWTPTPPPPLTEEEIRQKMLWYFETNGGYELPCWWGIIPDKTTLQEVEERLVPLADRYTRDGSFMGLAIYHLVFPSLEEINPELGFHLYLFTDKNIIQIVDIDDDFARPYNEFTLSDYLQYFGEPGQVFVNVHYVGVILTLVYPEQGVVLTNGDLYDGLKSDTKFEMCSADVGFLLSLNSPHLEIWDELIELYTPPDYALPLEEISNYSATDFYEIFKDPDSTECISGEVEPNN